MTLQVMINPVKKIKQTVGQKMTMKTSSDWTVGIQRVCLKCLNRRLIYMQSTNRTFRMKSKSLGLDRNGPGGKKELAALIRE